MLIYFSSIAFWTDLLNPPPAFKVQEKAPEAPAPEMLTEEEERELEELMGEE
jgi:hypothetical protein